MTKITEPDRPRSAARPDARRETPALRPERIALARERIARRYYDRPDVQRALLEALWAELYSS